jgi:hypothetical protein
MLMSPTALTVLVSLPKLAVLLIQIESTSDSFRNLNFKFGVLIGLLSKIDEICFQKIIPKN